MIQKQTWNDEIRILITDEEHLGSVQISIPLYVSDEQNIDGYPTYEEARQEMIDLWNTRIPEKEASNEL